MTWITWSPSCELWRVDIDQVPSNVKQLGTAKISFSDQQRHSSQVRLTHTTCTHTGCSKKTQSLLGYNFKNVSHSVTRFSPKCPETTWQHKNGSLNSGIKYSLCSAWTTQKTSILTTFSTQVKTIQFATSSHYGINRNDFQCVHPLNERSTTVV